MLTPKQLADWGRGAIRDEIGIEAAEFVLAFDRDVMLFGDPSRETRAMFERLDADDRARVFAFWGHTC